MKDVCDGLCDSTTYSRYERGELTPEMFTAAFFLERMGVDSSGIQYAFSYEEAEAIHMRRVFDGAARKGDISTCEDLVDYYKEKYSKKTVHRQYICLLKAKIAELSGNKIESPDLYRKGFLETHLLMRFMISS